VDLPQSSSDGCLDGNGSPLSSKLMEGIENTKDIASAVQYLTEGTEGTAFRRS
jgi:hypothetical protein